MVEPIKSKGVVPKTIVGGSTLAMKKARILKNISEIWTLITLIRLIRHTYFNMFNILSSIVQSLF